MGYECTNIICERVGVVVTDIQGNSIDLNHVKGAIIAHPDIHEDIINIIKRINKISCHIPILECNG